MTVIYALEVDDPQELPLAAVSSAAQIYWF